MKTRLHVVAFGCQMSVADGGELAQPLLARGFRAVARPEDADAIVLNTCTVRQHAEDKALSMIGRLRAWKEDDPARVLIVAGCAAERLGGWIRTRFPHVDLVVGAKSIEDYPRVVEEALAARFDALSETRAAFSAPASEAAPDFPVGWSSAVVAPVTIMRGCNYSCSYCIVPRVRGRESYRPYETVLAEIRAKAGAGAREILLLGQTVNSWHARGDDGRERRFSDLLRAAAAVEGVARVRFESPHPHFVDDALIAALAEVPQAGDAVHMPVQSGSDRVLALMRRNYTAASYLEKIARLRAAAPAIEVSTDIIVGFPTETDSDFERTLELVERLRPSSAYTFKYSPREGTESAETTDDVPADVKEERLSRLNALCDGYTEGALRARIGRTVEVLDENGGYGRTRDGFRVKWAGPAEPGRLTMVRVTGTMKRTLLGKAMISDKKSKAERRQHRRFSVVAGMIEPITIDMGTEHGKSQPAIMTDLSAGGMSLLMFCEPPHATSIQMLITIPGLDRVPVEALIQRVLQKGETYSVGLSFTKIAKKIQDRIAGMADDNADCETRVSLRLPEACVPDCSFHSLCAKPVKAPHWKK